MIPKILHYCWLSDKPIPVKLQSYINGWKKIMPDYQLKKWDKNAFDIHSVKWVEDAYANQKWAFAADYIRAYALYTEGGFYLDSDVLVNHRFDDYLNCGFVSSIEYNHSLKESINNSIDKNYQRKSGVECVKELAIQAAIIGAEKGHSFPKEILGYYHTHVFIENGKMNLLPAPVIYSLLLESKGFVYKDSFQQLKNSIHIFESNVFAGFQTCDFSSIAIHMCAGSWLNTIKKEKGLFTLLFKNLLVRKIINSLVRRPLKSLSAQYVKQKVKNI